mgnify:CR=1 FL=1
MWAHLRGVASAQQRDRDAARDTENGPTPETTIRRRRSPERSIDSTNPRHRRRQRTAEVQRCCQCTRFATCGADPRAVCECRSAGRECSNCCTGKNCKNRPWQAIVTTPPPGDRTVCRPVATTAPARRNRGTGALPTGSQAEPSTPAPANPTVAPPVAEEVPNQSNLAPNPTGTTTGALSTPGTEVAAFPDLSQTTETEEIRANNDDDGRTDGDLPVSGGTVEHVTAPVPVEIQAQDPSAEDPEKMLDLAGQQSTISDLKLMAVYGDTTHRNDGRHLHGGVPEDEVWQRRYDQVVANPHKLYLPPQGKVGKAVVSTYAKELRGVRERRWNSERPLCFLACILRRRPDCTRSADIKRRIENRLRLWEDGKFDALIQDITSAALNGASRGTREAQEEQEAWFYNSSVLDGNLRTAVRNLTDGVRGGVLGPEDLCTKTGRPVIEVLRDKHPDQRLPDLSDPNCLAFCKFDEVPDPIPLDCGPEVVEAVARKLTGAAGCSSVDSALLKSALLRYGKASSELREEMLEWTLWLGNTSPPWAAYRAMRQGRLVALDKQPGVRPLGIGECWLRAVSKCVLKECGREGKAACGSTQLCAGLEAGIEGAIHSIRKKAAENKSQEYEEWEIDDDLWRKEAEEGETPPWEASPNEEEFQDAVESQEDLEDPFVLTLADADNGFNNLNRQNMLWEVRHRWARGSRFAFNLYRHDARLMVRGPAGTEPQFLLSKEGVTQGCPLGMILYGVSLLSLAEDLRESQPGLLQPWYADDFSIYGRASQVASLFNRLCAKGPSVGYFPAPAKSWAICPKRVEGNAKAILDAAGLPVKWSRGQRYVGGFIGSSRMQERWLQPMVQKWVGGVERLAKVALRYPQSAYAGLVNCLQAEWQYLCRVEPGVGPHLEPVEAALRTKFIPALLGGQESISDELRLLIAQGVKQGGLAIRDPVSAAARLYQTSTEATALLVKSLTSNSHLDNEAHAGCVRGAGTAARKERIADGKEVVEDISQRRGPKVRKRLERMMETGAWLTAIPDRMSGTELSFQEWHDNISLRYGMVPRGLPRKCDGCGAGFTVEHGLNCKKGGLVSLRHNDVRDEWAHLCGLALGESRVTTEPLIFYGDGMRTQPGTGLTTSGNSLGEEARGDVSAHGFWQRARSTVFDVRITDTDAKSYGNCSSAKLLERFAREKRDKYEGACLERRKDFTPLCYSVDGMPCEAARSAERRLASLLAAKWDRQYSEMVNFVRTRMSLSVVRSNTLLLRSERAHSWKRRAPEDGTAAAAAPTFRPE